MEILLDFKIEHQYLLRLHSDTKSQHIIFMEDGKYTMLK